jgi:quercetin dioxygenase-like cupin family protein
MRRLAVFAAVCAAALAFATAAAAIPAEPGGGGPAGPASTAAASALAASAAPIEPAHGVHITPLSAATIRARVHTNSAGIEIETDGARDMLVTSIVVDPGGSFGWHTHPGPVLVSISQGTLALYQPDHGRCPRSTFTAGQGFIEDGGDVHLARNEGAEPVELNAIFLARTGTTEFLKGVAEPAGCHV